MSIEQAAAAGPSTGGTTPAAAAGPAEASSSARPSSGSATRARLLAHAAGGQSNQPSQPSQAGPSGAGLIRAGVNLTQLPDGLLRGMVRQADAAHVRDNFWAEEGGSSLLRWQHAAAGTDRERALSALQVRRSHTSLRDASTVSANDGPFARTACTGMALTLTHLAQYGRLSRRQFDHLRQTLLAQHPQVLPQLQAMDPESRQAAISAIVHHGRNTALPPAAFLTAVREVLGDKADAGVDLSRIPTAAQRQQVLQALLDKTDLRRLLLRAPASPDRMAMIPPALRAPLLAAHQEEMRQLLLLVHTLQEQNPGLHEMHLDCSASCLRPQDVALLGQLTQLTSLNASGVPLDAQGAAEIAKLTRLRSLDLSCPLFPLVNGIGANSIGAAGAQQLAVLTQLEDLVLAHQQLGTAELAPLLALPRLKNLDLTGNNLQPQALQALPAPAQLQTLRCECTVRDAAALGEAGTAQLAAWLAPCTQLQELALPAQAVGDAGIAALCTLEPLRRLDVAGGNLSDAAATHLAERGRFTHLDLQFNPQLTKAGVAPLRALPGLQVLKTDLDQPAAGWGP